MALLIRGKTACSICGTIIAEDREIVMFPHFIGNQDSPLYPFSDSAMHRNCFLTWDYRAEFVARYNRDVGSITWGNGTYHQMQDDGTILLLPR